MLDPAVTLRRVAVLLERLPPGAWPDSAHAASWSTEAHLLAGVIDVAQSLLFVTLKANGAKSVKQPAPLPRPGQPARGTRERASGERLGWKALADALTGGGR